MDEPKSTFVDAETIRLHYLEWDSHKDRIPLVMLHGLAATADTWRLVAARLRGEHLMIAFDLRGHGQSDRPENGYDLATVAEDVVQGMAALGLGKVVLIAHGWGARVALVLTARHPALVSRLVLVDCPHVEPKHWPGMTRKRFVQESAAPEMFISCAAYLAALQDEMAAFWTPEVEAIVLAAVRELPDGRVEELLRREDQQRIRQTLWDDRALVYYSKLACPVLLVPAAAQPDPGGHLPEKLQNTEEFAVAKAYMAAQVARLIRHCSVLWMPRTAHDIQLHRPDVLAKAIADFIKDEL